MQPSADLFRQLTDYDANRRGSLDVLNEAMSQYGVPEIRKRVAGLRTTLSNTETALNNVDPSVTGRTQGSMVTEAQRQAQVANERKPITEQYGQQSRALGDESGNLSDQMQAAQTLAQGRIGDYDRGRQSLAERYGMALSAEQEQRRREEADRAFRLQQEQAGDARRAAAAQLSMFGGGGGSPAAPANDGGRKAAIEAEARRIASKSAAAGAAGDVKASQKAKAQSDRYSGPMGFINYIADYGPRALNSNNKLFGIF